MQNNDKKKPSQVISGPEVSGDKKGYWMEISVTTTPEAAEMVGEILIECGCGGVVYHDPFIFRSLKQENIYIKDDIARARGETSDIIIPGELLKQDFPYRVSGYLPLRDELEETIEKLKNRLDDIAKELPVGEGSVALKQVKEEDWANAWKAYFKPESIGKITISPSWIDEEYPLDGVVIKVDPGMAFGTGAHPSTRLSLHLLQESIKGGELIYDIGTGSGILAVSAAKLGASRVTAVDIDPVAVEVARENIQINEAEEKVTAVRGDLLNDLAEGADLIIANIIAEVIIKITPRVRQLLKSKGFFISSGIIDSKAQQVQETLLHEGFIIENQLCDNGWVAFLARRG